MRRCLRNAYQKQTGLRTPLFEPKWHELIVKKANQLKAFHHYILNNPKMALMRRKHSELFHCFRNYSHIRLGNHRCDLVGNLELLDEPAFLAVRISRSVEPNSATWERELRRYQQWRFGMTAVGTWWSPAEKEAAQQILARGGEFSASDATWHRRPVASSWGHGADTLCTRTRSFRVALST